MKKIIAMTALGAWLAMGPPQARAATTNTNFVLTVSISLTGYLQETNTPNGDGIQTALVTTRSVMAVLWAAVSNTSPLPARAELLAITTVGGPSGGVPAFVIRTVDHGTNVNTDVSNVLIARLRPSVTSTRTTAGRTSGVEYHSLDLFTSNTGNLGDFGVRGFVIFRQASLVLRGAVVDPLTTRTINGTVAGSGTWIDRDGILQRAVFRGTLFAGAGRVEFEVVP